MKQISVEQLATQSANWLRVAQKDRVLITKNGRPSAVIVGIENQDEEDWNLQLSPAFWRMIEKRRREPTIPWEQVKAELLNDELTLPSAAKPAVSGRKSGKGRSRKQRERKTPRTPAP